MWLTVAPAYLDEGRGQGGNWKISPFSPRNLEGSYLLHQLPQLPTPAVSGAGALCRDHGRADAFPIGGLGRSVQLPAFLWALEEGLWGGQGSESRDPMGDSLTPAKRERELWKTTNALCWTPGMRQTTC